MSWQDVREHYEERDEDPVPDDVEVVTEPCPGCGDPYTHAADECDPCCSAKCADLFHADRQAAVNAALAGWWAKERETVRTFRCTECGADYQDYPTTDGACSTSCRLEQIARLYDQPPY
jgi:hypothetical protein